MKTLVFALTLSAALSACAFTPPSPPQPADAPRVPINKTAPPPLQLEIAK